MSDSPQELNQSSLAFFGAITASATHELNNVFAIIEQTSGLLEDLCAADDSEIRIKRERILNIAERISRQLQRGTEITRRLNAFAHSADEPYQGIEINSLLEPLVALMQRQASLKKLTLELRPIGPVSISTRPFILELALFQAIQWAISRSRPQGEIVVAVQINGEGAVIQVESEDADSGGELNVPPALQSAVQGVGGTVKIVKRDQLEIIEMAVPRNLQEAV